MWVIETARAAMLVALYNRVKGEAAILQLVCERGEVTQRLVDDWGFEPSPYRPLPSAITATRTNMDALAAIAQDLGVPRNMAHSITNDLLVTAP